MATLTLRPTSDDACTIKCSSGSSRYLLINEEVADDDATYIYVSVGSTNNAGGGAIVTLGGTLPSGKFKVTGAKLCIRAKATNSGTSSVSVRLASDKNDSSFSVTTSYETYSDTNVGATYIGKTYTSSSFPDSIYLNIKADGAKANSKDSSFEVRITQAYLELEYELIGGEPGFGIYIKVVSTWKEIKSAYKKVNGEWISITSEDCKSILQSTHCKLE